MKDYDENAVQEDLDAVISKLDFLNVEEGLSSCMDDKDFYLDVLRAFVEDNVLDDLRKLYLNSEWANYRVKAHGLKSSSAYIGADELNAKAKRMEEAAKIEDVDFINLNHHRFIALYEDLLRKLIDIVPRSDESVNDIIHRFTLAVVDDSKVNRQVVKEILGNEYNIVEASSGNELFQMLEDGSALDLILLDVHMPNEDGHSVIKKLKADERYHDIPVVFMTADSELTTELNGFEEGAVDFITKPIWSQLLRARIKRIMELYYLQKNLQDEVKVRTKAIDEKHQQMEMMFDQIIQALVNTINAKDKYTKGHSERVSKYSVMLADAIGFNEEELNRIKYAALLHDIGKIGVPGDIINKPARLTDEEYGIIKKHPVIGSDILKSITSGEMMYQGARWHHERIDGKGYPDGLKGEEIPLVARIIGVADAYDAMTSARAYRNGMSQAKVKEEIKSNLGTQFDTLIGRMMLHIIEMDKDFKLHE